MNITALLARADESGLNEYEAKALLQSYGVPVVEEMVVQDRAQAVSAARDMGFPVVLKALGRRLLHKTERGLVHLNLADATAVESACHSIARAAGDELEGYLLQPQLEGKREFVAGLLRDSQFGPVVMFGLGGIFTEAFSDVTFRLAPLSETDAAAMLTETKSAGLLGRFRGEQAVDRDQLIKTLLALSHIGLELPAVTEVDINPLLAGPDGRLWAVDALVVAAAPKGPAKMVSRPVAPDAIGSLFYPRSIAFVGASAQIGKWGYRLMANTVSGGYQGAIYLVNPKGGTIAGRRVFRTLSEIPAKIDLAVVTVPAAKVLGLIPELQQKGIRNLLLITSGFGETGEKGRQLEKALVAEARRAGILILGPNTMGICNPHINFYCTGSPIRPRAGSTAVVSQSGNMGIQLLAFSEQQDIGIRGFCGSGNEAMMTVEDFLEGFEVDTLTRTVMLYIESVKDGRRFFESARRLGVQKPIVLLKGGRSSAGSRAAASHTGALTTDTRVFDAVCRQAGIVRVKHPMDLLDLSAAFSSLPLPGGNRTAIITLGGGWGVVCADLCNEFGLEVPELSREIVKRIDRILPPYWSRSNPIDLVGESDPTIPLTVLEALMKWSGCDAVINLGILGRRIMIERFGRAVRKADPGASAELVTAFTNQLAEFEDQYIRHIIQLMEKYNKPIFGVSLLPDESNKTVYRVADQRFKAVFYPTPERAVKACAKMFEYRRFLNRQKAL